MKNAPDKPYLIKGAKKLASLKSPVRQEILDALHALGPGSVAEIAEALNRAPDSLYYHLNILLDVGLVRETGQRTTGPRPEVIYDLPGRPMKIKYDSTPGTLRAISKAMSGMLRLTDRDFQATLLDPNTKLSDREKVLTAGRLKAWLDPEQIAQINDHLAQIELIMSSGQKAPNTELVAFSRVLVPLNESRRTRSSNPTKDS